MLPGRTRIVCSLSWTTFLKNRSSRGRKTQAAFSSWMVCRLVLKRRGTRLMKTFALFKNMKKKCSS
jgi:hypothetical protein